MGFLFYLNLRSFIDFFQMSFHILENQKRIIQIKNEFNALKNKENVVFENYSQKIDVTTQERYNSLERYHQCEKEAAQRLYDGTLLGIENDFERQQESLSEKINDFILFKYKIIAKEFPKAAEYFAQFGKQSQFIQTFHQKFLDLNKDESVIKLSDEPLLNPDEIESLINSISSKNKSDYSLQGQNLIGPNEKFSSGSSAVLKMGNGIEHHGVIQSITDYFVVFLPNDGPLFQIPIKALNMGLASLSKN